MPEQYTLTPIGHVRGGRSEEIDDDWGAVVSTIALDPNQFDPDAIAGLDAFSHVEVVFVFHLVDDDAVTAGARHPRGRADWPRVGIFAQRARMRPNRLGVTVCELQAVNGLDLTVRGLDAMDGSPVVDLKPYMREFAPRTPTVQPPWSTELMSSYWSA